MKQLPVLILAIIVLANIAFANDDGDNKGTDKPGHQHKLPKRDTSVIETISENIPDMDPSSVVATISETIPDMNPSSVINSMTKPFGLRKTRDTDERSEPEGTGKQGQKRGNHGMKKYPKNEDPNENSETEGTQTVK